MQIDIIGDIHGCYAEFVALTKKLGYDWTNGFPVHPRGRKLGFVGDLTDRGPESLHTIETVYSLVENNVAYYVPGNHCNKLYRFFLGRNVQITHGLETTVAEYHALSAKEQAVIKRKFISLYESAPLYARLDGGNLIIAHAGIRQNYIGRYDKKVQTFVLYGDITGETNPDGTPVSFLHMPANDLKKKCAN
jgi:protein phosphatase